MNFEEIIARTGWAASTIGAEFEIQQGKAVAAKWKVGNEQKPFLRTRNVLWDALDLEDVDTMVFSDSEMARLELRPGDLLTCEGGDIGRTAMWAGAVASCFYQNHLHRLRPKSQRIDSRFALHWLRAAFTLLQLFGGAGNKTTIPNLSATRLKGLPIPVPAYAEQRAIAELLDDCAEAGRVERQLVAKLEELRAAVVSELLKRHDTSAVALESAIIDIRYGTSVRSDYATDGGVPVLRIPNVAKETVDTTDLKFSVLSPVEKKRLHLAPGDLLFVRTNGSKEYVGRCAVYDGSPQNAVFASYLIRVRLNDETWMPRFVRTYLSSAGRSQILARATPAADGKFNIDTGILKSLHIPLIPMGDQRAIAEAADDVSARLVIAREKAERLEELYRSVASAVLTRAFSLPTANH